MADRPYVLLSCAVSLDGYLDAGQGPLVLSNEEDLARVHAVRAGCDAILVGAGTLRTDDPRLLARGHARSPAKVTLTRSGRIPPDARFLTDGDVPKLVYCAHPVAAETSRRLTGRATVVDAGDTVEPSWVLDDLARRGVRRLMVEGGGSVLRQFLADRLADELQLAVAPFLVGDPTATPFVAPGVYPWRPGHRARLAGVRQIGDVALLVYALSRRWPGPEPRDGEAQEEGF